ncbi:MAG TPA: VacJ family lipoprotein [Micropepsaceae bacterium]|jgi:phospholipid-binding lipoprotein MlaA|nr:VacJ family lipoprotein [Micropepsaceae bacterium]
MNALSRIFAAVLVGFVLAGCATTPATEGSDVNDPLEGWNRTMFRVTLAVDKAVFRPTAIAYRDVFPQPVRDSVRNFLNNLNSPVVLANDILQGEANRAGITLLRAGVNTTIGVGGLFDIAQKWGYQRHSEDFGQTLAVWGVGEGPYLFLPLFGPANPRDLFGYVTDIFFDPITYAQWDGKIYYQIGRSGIDYLDLRERNIETLDEIEKGSLDYYASIRSLYRQTRNNEIMNGATQVQDLPDF